MNNIVRKLKINSLTSSVTFTGDEEKILEYLNNLFANTEMHIHNSQVYYMDRKSYDWIMDMKECVDYVTNKPFFSIYLNSKKTSVYLFRNFKFKFSNNLNDLLIYLIKDHYHIDKTLSYNIFYMNPSERNIIEYYFKTKKYEYIS